MCEVLNQTKNGSPASWAALMNFLAAARNSSSHGLHPLLGQRAGVLDLLAALAVGPAVQHAARPVLLLELGEVLRVRIVDFLGLFLGVQVIQVAEELVEAVHRRQMLVAVAEMVLAELAGAIAERLERLGDGDVLGLEAQLRAGKTDLGEAGAQAALAGDERRAPGGAALLGIGVGEDHAFLGDAVDVGRLVAHQAHGVATEVRLADVVAPHDQDIRLPRLGVLGVLRGLVVPCSHVSLLGMWQCLAPTSVQLAFYGPIRMSAMGLGSHATKVAGVRREALGVRR